MKHFIAYHNTEKMGRTLQDGDPLRVLTSKPVEPLVGNTVWFIAGEGATGRQYSLGSVFRVTHVGEAPEGDFKHFASGTGHVFHPPILLAEEAWFTEILRFTAHFSLGLTETKDTTVIAALSTLASSAGHRVP